MVKRDVMRVSAVVVIIIAMTVFAGCRKEGQDGIFTALTENYNSPKDYIGGNVLFWSDGDRVKINNGTYTVTLNGSSATINASDVTTYGGKYYAAYPAGYASIATDGTVTFDLPRKESYTVSGGNQVIHSVMAAKTDGSELLFSNLCSLLHFKLKASGSGIGAKLCAIEVSSDKPLCGRLSAVHNGSAWNVTSPTGTSDTVRILTFSTPVELDGTAKDFYLLVAPVSGAATFNLRYVLEDGSSNVMVFDKRKSSSVADFAKGNIYHFEENTFNGTVMVFASGNISPVTMSGTLENPYLVSSETTWGVFVSTHGGNSSKHIALANDIEVAGSSYDGFAATLDGKGHTITLTGSNPLFTSISGGTVKNVVFEASSMMTPSTEGSSTRFFGVVAKQGTNATIQNCVNHVDVQWMLGSIQGNIGAFLGNASGCTFDGCINEGSVSSDAAIIGGIVGSANNSAIIRNSSNSGVITYQTASAVSRSIYCGGIAGDVAASVKVANCTNIADMIISGDITTITANSFIGGVLGRTSGGIKNCHNRGDIIVSSSTTCNKYIGGVVGGDIDNTADTMLNCYNEGNIVREVAANRMYVGGLMGYNSKMTIKNCYACCNLSGNSVAGIVCDGSNLYGEVPISNCYYYGTLSGSTQYGICGVSPSDVNRFAYDHCYCPSGSNMAGNKSRNAGNNNTLVDAFTVTGGSALYSTLNGSVPAGGKNWKNGTDHVVFYDR